MKAFARDSYKANPEKKKASARDSCMVDPESKRSAKRRRYEEDLEENRSAKRRRYEEDLEENRAAKRRRYEEDLEGNRAQGRIQGFPKGGVETRDTKCGGVGVLPASGPIRKAGGCCPFKARYEKRKGGGGGGGGGCCPALQARYKKRGRGRGCLAEEGALPYMKGGVATPKPPPGSASGAAKRQKYHSAAIKASERSRYWNDPAVRLAKRAAERTRYRRGQRTTTIPPKGMLWHVVLTLKSCACSIVGLVTLLPDQTR